MANAANKRVTIPPYVITGPRGTIPVRDRIIAIIAKGKAMARIILFIFFSLAEVNKITPYLVVFFYEN